MYTIVMNDDKSLTRSVSETIHQFDSNTSYIRFLVPTTIDNNDMSEYVATFKYVLPDNSTKYCDLLTAESELYNDEFIDYRLAVKSKMTKQCGIITGYLSFLKVVENDDGSKTAAVLNSGETHIKIEKCANIFNNVDDIQAIDAKILELQSLIDELTKYQTALSDTKADDIEVVDGEIWLTANGEQIGTPIEYVSIDNIEERIIEVMTDSTIDGGDADDLVTETESDGTETDNGTDNDTDSNTDGTEADETDGAETE